MPAFDADAEVARITQLYRLQDLTQEQWTTFRVYVRSLAGELPGPIRWVLAFSTVAALWARGRVPVQLIPPTDFSAAAWLAELGEPEATIAAARAGVCTACRAVPHSAGRPRCDACHAAFVRGEGQ